MRLAGFEATLRQIQFGKMRPFKSQRLDVGSVKRFYMSLPFTCDTLKNMAVFCEHRAAKERARFLVPTLEYPNFRIVLGY